MVPKKSTPPNSKNFKRAKEHIPVLIDEVLRLLDPKRGESYLDLTAGYGGHALLVLGRTLNGSATLVDRDKQAIDALKKRFASSSVRIVHNDFLTASRQMLAKNEQFDLILADLGLSSLHLDDSQRGFAIRKAGPLDMRMDRRSTLTAETIVNTYSEQELTNILRRYGEEPRARRIAKAIVDSRPLKTTTELAEVIARISGKRIGKIHPATRSFQALRIAVNNELELLEKALPIWIKLLKPGGRIAVISFHSLEDRLVKRAFAEAAGKGYDRTVRLLTKKPIIPSRAEVVSNPRARSAKLRAAVKIKINPATVGLKRKGV